MMSKKAIHRKLYKHKFLKHEKQNVIYTNTYIICNSGWNLGGRFMQVIHIILYNSSVSRTFHNSVSTIKQSSKLFYKTAL